MWQYFRATATMKQLVGTIWGTIGVRVASSEFADHTRIEVVATANIDNVYALERHPAAKMIERLHRRLAAHGGVSPLDPSLRTLNVPDALLLLDDLTKLRRLLGVVDDSG